MSIAIRMTITTRGMSMFGDYFSRALIAGIGDDELLRLGGEGRVRDHAPHTDGADRVHDHDLAVVRVPADRDERAGPRDAELGLPVGREQVGLGLHAQADERRIHLPVQLDTVRQTEA